MFGQIRSECGGMSHLGDEPVLEAVRLSEQAAPRRADLIGAYRRQVYEPAFPDASIREDPEYWLSLLDSTDYPPPPQPLIDVILLLDGESSVIGGVTIEFYRTARCGLLTYVSVAPEWRGRGIGRRLVSSARSALDRLGGADVPMLAETERLEDAADAQEAAATMLRQRQLAGLGARWIDFDYVMPPLRPDSEPHRLHLMLFDPAGTTRNFSAATVAALLRELALALGTDVAAFPDTRAMMARLDSVDELPVRPLPALEGK